MTEIKDGEITTYIRGKDLKEYDILNDVYKEEYGKFRVVSNYKNGVKNGKETIYFDDYYEEDYSHLDEYGCPERKKIDDLIRSEVNYVNGKKEGDYSVKSVDGHYEIQASFKNGKLDGKYCTYDAKGDPMFEVNFVNGKKEGEQKRYNSRLHIGGEGDYEEVYQGIWYITNYKHGVKNGKETEYASVYVDSYSDYAEKGELLGEKNYVNGKLEGYDLKYYNNGNLREKLFFENGRGEGEWKKYYETGELKEISHLIHGVYEGEILTYYKSGQLQNKANYKKGIRLGPDITYSESGKIIKQENWVMKKNVDLDDPLYLLSPSIPEGQEILKENPLKYLQKGYSIKEVAEKLGEKEEDLRKKYGDIYD